MLMRLAVVALVCLFFSLCNVMISHSQSQATSTAAVAADELSTAVEKTGGYHYWRHIAVNLAKLPADQVLAELGHKDPFEMQAFEARLLRAESKKGSLLALPELKRLFKCPPNEKRMTLPDARNQVTLKAFRKRDDANRPFTFLFFQHLRKAGGTTFCNLVGRNLPPGSVPPYFCMPDFQWRPQDTVCAGCLGRWETHEIVSRLQAEGHLMAGNEWDAFDPSRFLELPAVFATIFRRPLDRALSQFRFECIEDRGCEEKNVTKWWETEKDLRNVYTWTFTNLNRLLNANVYRSSRPSAGEIRGNLVGQALDTMSKFHLILVMEWLGYSEAQVESVLGFSNLALLTHRVRPHMALHARNDGQEVNQLGAGGVDLASWSPKEYCYLCSNTKK